MLLCLEYCFANRGIYWIKIIHHIDLFYILDMSGSARRRIGARASNRVAAAAAACIVDAVICCDAPCV